jgi:hypothetical protein
MLADNRLALNAGWDLEMLRLELEALAEHNFPLELTGFDEQELNELARQALQDPTKHLLPLANLPLARGRSGSWASTVCCAATEPNTHRHPARR